MVTATSWTAERARVASLTRSRPANDPDLIRARQNLRALRLADDIRRALADDPSLTEQHRQELASLLLNSGGGQLAS